MNAENAESFRLAVPLLRIGRGMPVIAQRGTPHQSALAAFVRVQFLCQCCVTVVLICGLTTLDRHLGSQDLC